jgi:hypothetical protein
MRIAWTFDATQRISRLIHLGRTIRLCGALL